VVRAFAKINLTLRVLGVRSDGYHELRTTFQSIALHDTLTFTKSDEFALECDDMACPADSTNLVWRAADALWQATGRKGPARGLRVRLEKRVPMQAGLGGGSSDAAATLRVLARMWNVDAARVRQTARALGADVPYFLQGGTALGVERGDVLFPLTDWPAAWVVVVLPPFGVSTKDAYAWFDAGRNRQTGSGAFVEEFDKGSRPPFPEMWNDLEPPVAERHPEIRRLIRALTRGGATYAAMSGSGSAVFALFEDRSAAEACAARLATGRTGALVTRTLTRAAFVSRSRPGPR
jgi:4-diphosphocytidyl-2-C-methyl-D-erythritol kinase